MSPPPQSLTEYRRSQERLLQLLFARAGALGGGPDGDEHDDETAEEGGGEPGAARPRRRFRIVTSGEDGDEVAQDCLMM